MGIPTVTVHICIWGGSCKINEPICTFVEQKSMYQAVILQWNLLIVSVMGAEISINAIEIYAPSQRPAYVLVCLYFTAVVPKLQGTGVLSIEP